MNAEHAVQAGLGIVEAMPKLVTAAALPLRVRVGIGTGLVVVGDLRGSGEAQERGVGGETPNLAARLQAIADPDTVVIAEGTRKLLGNLFVLEDLGALDLKGIAGPVRAWAALRSSAVESRFEALHATDLTWYMLGGRLTKPAAGHPSFYRGASVRQSLWRSVTENLTTELSRIRDSSVIARNTAFTYKGKSIDAKEIGKELGVRYVLEGHTAGGRR
jgi:hypothetical protein